MVKVESRAKPVAHTGRLALLALLVLHVALAAGYALLVPPWNTPDEPAHYNYVEHVATTRTLPVLQVGDYDQALLERLTSERFPPGSAVDRLRYEGHQPPLFYLALAPVHGLVADRPAAERVVALRLVSVVFSAATVYLSWRVARLVLPGTALPLAAAGILAFVPGYTAVAGAINNDALAVLLATAVLGCVLVAVRRGLNAAERFGLGVLLGLLLLTKLTVYVFVPLAVGVVAWLEWRRGGWRGLRTLVVPLLVVPMAMALPWYARNVAVYGWPDVLGQMRHDLVVVGQPRTGTWTLAHAAFLLRTTFQSFWAQFGWMGVVMPDWVYRCYLLLTVAAALGLLVAALRWAISDSWARAAFATPSGVPGAPLPREAVVGMPPSIVTWGLLGLATVAVGMAFVGYNLTFVQAQGRYLYPALLPIALLQVKGLATLARGGGERPWPRLVGAGARGVAWLVPLFMVVEIGGFLVGGPLPRRYLYPLLVVVAAALGWVGSKRGGASGPIGLTVVGLAGLNVVCLLGYVTPYFHGS